MARVDDYSSLNRRQIAATLGDDPASIAAFESLQEAAFSANPAAAQAAQDSADAAGQAAAGAQDAATAAGSAAGAAQDRADAAYGRADDAYELADGKVAKNAGPVWAAPAASPIRTAVPAYTGGAASAAYDQAEVAALKAQVAALTGLVAALVVDGRANRSLTN